MLREATVPLLPSGHAPVRLLHLSDLHLTPGQRRKQDWVRDLAGLDPDLVVDTGDHLCRRDSVPVVLDVLGGLLDVPGVFVFGSNDYFEPTLRNPVRYLLPDTGKRHITSAALPYDDLRAGLTAAGWRDLTNRRDSLMVGDLRFAFAGVDDPHLEYDRLDEVAGPADPDADVRLGVARAPYLRVLSDSPRTATTRCWPATPTAARSAFPGGRALTTNCDLEPARAKGLHRHPADSQPGDPGACWLRVSAGLGTSPYAQIRLACRPEATLLTLVGTDSEGPSTLR